MLICIHIGPEGICVFQPLTTHFAEIRDNCVFFLFQLQFFVLFGAIRIQSNTTCFSMRRLFPSEIYLSFTVDVFVTIFLLNFHWIPSASFGKTSKNRTFELLLLNKNSLYRACIKQINTLRPSKIKQNH